MGDLVLGLAKTVVEGTLVKAKAAIDDEEKLRQSVQRDLVFITSEFQMMQCFLNNTDDERTTNAVVKTWVRQVRDLAYDVEDCIEFVVHLDKKSALWRVVPSCMAPALPLDEAVAEIQQLKARVQDVSQRNTRYNLISDSGYNPVVAQQHTADAGATEFDMLDEAKDAARKHRGLWDLTELITSEDSDLQVISVWGTRGDLGITSIVREAYDDQEICQNFTCRAWVKLMHPFNPNEFIRSLLAQFYANSRQEQRANVGVDVLKRMKKAVATEDLADEFARQVSEQRYLVVLENLSTAVEWDTARTFLSDAKNGSRIIVSTQHFEIANLCMGHPRVISEIRKFSADHSVCFLFKEGSHRDKCKEEVSHGVASPPNEHIHPLGRGCEAACIRHILDTEMRRNNPSLAFRVMSVWGPAGAEKSALVRTVYLGQMELKYSHRWGKYGWIDVPHPFNLTEFSRRLILDLFPETTEAEENDYFDFSPYGSIEDLCRVILREHRCLVVINGLQSNEDWDSINTTLELGASKSRYIVITNEESLAKCCADSAGLMCQVNSLEPPAALNLLKDQGSQRNGNKREDEVGRGVDPPPRENLHPCERLTEADDIHRTLDMVDVEMRWRDSTFGFHVISVWGIPAVGKSALVKSIYDSQMKFRYSHRWSKYSLVNVSRPFNLRKFCWSLLSSLSSKTSKAKTNEYMLSIKDPIKECRDILHEHRCLVVIDDLQSMEEWETINTDLELGASRSRYIVITNEASLAEHCAGRYYVNNIKSLEPDAALQFFKDKLTESQLEFCQLPEIMEQVKLTLPKCGGLPVVIDALRDYMVTEGIGEKWKWQLLNHQFMHRLKNDAKFHGLQHLFAWMRSYFRTCPDFLNPCIFYLPIFPLNYNIRQKRLTRRWIAEGYSRDTVDATAEENGKKYFSKLVDLSIIQRSQSITWIIMEMVSCQFNGFFHEYIMSQPREDNLIFALEKRCSQNSQRTGRHLVIRCSWDRDKNVFESIDFSRLRSLTVFGVWRSFFISDKMKLLRVLDLEDTSGISDDHLEPIVKLLSRLKFLSLRGQTSITRLPTSLGNLRQLETLDVRHTSIVTLPPAIIKLHKLQYVRAGTTVPLGEEPSTQSRSKPCALLSRLPEFRRRRLAHLGVEVPRGVGKLTALHTLGVINVCVAEGKAILKELKNLTQLRGLGMSGINRENIQDFCSAISGHGHLESLSVRLDKDKQDFFGSLGDISQPPESLRRLKLYGLVDKLPVWIKRLIPYGVTKLDIEMSMLTQEIIDFLRDIKYIQILRLCVKPTEDDEKHLCASWEDGVGKWNFRYVQVLEIDCSSRLQVTFEEGTMLCLELLKVHCCSGSRISGLEHLEKLKEVWLMDSYDDALKRDLERQLAAHRKKPILKARSS